MVSAFAGTEHSMSERLDIAESRRLGRPVVIESVASECDLYGHDYQVRDFEGWVCTDDAPRGKHVTLREPGSVFCSRCGKSWKVER